MSAGFDGSADSEAFHFCLNFSSHLKIVECEGTEREIETPVVFESAHGGLAGTIFLVQSGVEFENGVFPLDIEAARYIVVALGRFGCSATDVHAAGGKVELCHDATDVL